MNIVIDLRMVTSNEFGISRYMYNIVDNFQKIDHGNEYTLLVNDKTVLPYLENNSNFRFYRIKAKFISVYEQIAIPLALNKLNFNLFHAPSFAVPFFHPKPMIVTLYDLNHVVFKHYYSAIYQIYFHNIVKPVVKDCLKVITISEFSKNELMRLWNIPPEKIEVIYCAVDECFHPIKKMKILEDTRKKYHLPQDFILYVGNKKPHKNIPLLMRAYANADIKIPLVLSGNVNNDLSKLISELGIQKRVMFIGRRVDDSDLPAVYNCATLFVYPSLYEGFGLPPLEAMACGVPVITSNTSSFPEVLGNADIMVDPYNCDELANAICNVLDDSLLRDRMSKQGIEQAKKFNWRESAFKTLRVYEEVCSI